MSELERYTLQAWGAALALVAIGVAYVMGHDGAAPVLLFGMYLAWLKWAVWAS